MFSIKYQDTKIPESNVSAVLGKHDLSDDSETNSKNLNVSEIIVHPDWDTRSISYDADIAVVVLLHSVEFGDNIQRVNLPQQSSDELVGTGTIVGWGRSEKSEKVGEYEAKNSTKLLVPTIDVRNCLLIIPDIGMISSKRTFCGGYVNQSKGPCSGDNGAGFFVKNSVEL